MNTFLRFIFVSTFSLILFGCATSNINNKFEFDPQKKTGLLIGSLSIDKKAGTAGVQAMVYVNQLNTTKTLSASGDNFRLEFREKPLGGLIPGFKNSELYGYYGRVFAVEVPAGIYEITSWRATFGQAGITPRYVPPKLLVEVKQREIVYVGNIHMNMVTGKNILGMQMPAGATPEIINMSDRDIPLFKEKNPQLSKYKIKHSVFPEGPWLSSPETSTHIETPPPIIISK